MDYQIVFQNPHLLVVIILIIFSVLPYSLAIVNRDLVLTPKQGLQLSGKRIFYEESTNNDLLHNNDTAGTRPWERTLKHVTYLTLFTNDPNGIITGNFSKVKEYNEFLQSPYVRPQKVHDSRFGDIVTLAQGRLVTTTNGSYHFIEGNCDYECARDSNIVAMWHVQKIRHRDTADRKYHYEMKFSVSPWTAKSPTETVVRGGPNKRTIMDEKRSNMQTFIQKEDDYPQSFTKIVSEQDEDFADRRFDAARNFRQVNQYQQSQQVTPIPQSTFLRGVYHPHPPPPLQQQQIPIPERLNIGEYFKGSYGPKATSKIELFPNLLNMMIGKTHNLLAPPTTFRPPTHPMKFPRPEIYTLPQQQIHEFSKFPDYHHHSHEQFTHKGPIQGAQYQIQGFPKFPEYHQHIKEQYVQQGPTQGPIHGPQEFPKFSEYHHQHSQEQFTQKGLTQNPQPQVQEFPKFAEYHHQHSQEQFTQKGPTQNPLVTHHYHHHFFMPNNSAANIDQAIHHSGEHKIVNPTELYKNEVTEVITPLPYTTNLYDKHATTLRQHNLQQHHYQQQQQQQHYQKQNYQQQNYQHIQEPLPPAPQKFIFPTTQIEQHRVVHVTPATPLRKPQYQHYYKTRPLTLPPEYTTGHVPLFISYPAPVNEEERADVPTPRNKPFLHSQPLDDTIHYSEPDPLYAHTTNQQEKEEEERFNSAGEDEHENDSQEPQLESPEHYTTTSRGKDTNKDHSDSVEAQLPAPNKVQNDQHQSDEAQVQEDSTQSQTKQNLLEQKTSQTSTSYKISTEKTTSNTIKTEASNSIITATNKPKTFPSRVQRISLKTATTTASTTTTSTTTTKKPKTLTKKFTTTTEKEKLSTSTTSKPRKHFVSTSSTETPLRTISRYRNSYARTSTSTTTTTEKPVLKWKPRRKSSNGKSMTLNNSTTQESQIEEIDNLDDNDEDDKDDIKAKESNNHQVTKLFMLTTSPTTEMSPESTTEMSNDITSSTSTMSSLLLSSPQIPLATQSVTEIYEVLTQKSVSKSVSLKVGNNGEEIPVIIDDEENEVKKV